MANSPNNKRYTGRISRTFPTCDLVVYSTDTDSAKIFSISTLFTLQDKQEKCYVTPNIDGTYLIETELESHTVKELTAQEQFDLTEPYRNIEYFQSQPH